MLTKEQAIAKIRSALPANSEFTLGVSAETERVFLFHPVMKVAVRAEEPEETVFGYSTCWWLVERESGTLRYIEAAQILDSAEAILHVFELGYFRFDHWDIEVTSVQDVSVAVEWLSRLEIESVTREGANGVYLNKRNRYTPAQLRQKLESLPARFYIGAMICFKWKLMESLKQQTAFSYCLSEHDWQTNCT